LESVLGASPRGFESRVLRSITPDNSEMWLFAVDGRLRETPIHRKRFLSPEAL
jgi:hypothetical protein